MDAAIAIAILATIAFLFGSPIYLLVRQRSLLKRLDDVERQLGRALVEIEQIARRLKAPSAPNVETAAAEPPVAATERSAPSPWKASRQPVDADEEQVDHETPAMSPEDVSGPTSLHPVADRDAPDGGRGVEETLTSKWLVWLGGITVALGAVFLFRYAVEQGWLTPFARVVLGLLLGGFLLSAGEWTARHPVEAVRRAMRPDYVPPALTGSGLLAVYVSLYAAHAIFGLLGPGTGFVAIGLVSYAALALSLRQGPFVAVLGLLGGYLVPALVSAPDPQAGPLFLYLFLLTAGCLLVMVWRKWWWFSFLTLAGAMTWPLLWLVSSWTLADQLALSAYGLGLALLFAVLSTRLPFKAPEAPLWRWLSMVLSDTSGLGFALSGVLLLAVADAAGWGAAAFAFLGLYALAALALAAWRESLDGLVVLSAAIAVAAALFWPDPAAVTPLTEIETFPRSGYGPFAVPEEYRLYMRALMVFGTLFGVGAFLGALRGRTIVVWAGVSALAPLLFFAIAYWRVGRFETDVSWAGVAAGLAALFTVAALVFGRRRAGREADLALALYAAAATAALGLAFACVLREAWLTVALSVQTLALAWIWSRVQVEELRIIAACVTAVVIVRLVANPMILDYEGDVLGLVGWVVYGYGIPAAATLAAAHIFARSGRDVVTSLCEIAGTGFAFLLVALQLRLWTAGEIAVEQLPLFDQAVQSLWWITAAGLLLIEARRGRRRWAYPAGLGLLAISVAAVILVHVLDQSPLVTGEPVGRLPVLNLLGLAYAAPAALFLAIASSERVELSRDLRRWLGALVGLLAFVFVTLETRRAFQGTDIRLDTDTWPGNAELYAYSAVWIVIALVLLATGILRRSQLLRYAALAVLMVTAFKVFLIDMRGLTGLLRVASFLGLGLTLIAIGRVYQRFVLAPGPAERSNDPPKV
jgi:uncharacterized membrane protein